MENKTLDISSALGTGWEYAKKHGLVLAVVILVVGVASSILQNLLGGSRTIDSVALGEQIGRGDMMALYKLMAATQSSAANAASFLAVIVEILVYVGLFNIALGLVSGRYTEVSFDGFKLPVMTYLKYLAVCIICYIIVVVSLFLCVVPFFFVAPRIAFAPMYIIENPEVGVIEAIKASWNMTSGNLLPIIGLMFVFIGISIVGLLCCCVGVYFASVVILFTEVAAYYQLKPADQ